MKPDGYQAAIEHEIAELRTAYPSITHARGGVEGRYSVWLDVRLPQHQSLISGPLHEDFNAALRAAFAAARLRLAIVPGP